VALRQGQQNAPSPDDLRAFVAERIAAYKVPEKITILDTLPLNATGKVDRKKLHEQVSADPLSPATGAVPLSSPSL
jgi:acyl-CoA synthetase (AMP-forming)/AMP-acid ligase II